ncbi:recombinase family protein [Candidatus Pacearchaeota archaeon]|nr:recombinase family protein [Candidatus Pacearchaeota archaeon]
MIKIDSQNAVAYIRLSSDDSSNPSLSPQNQQDIIKKNAEDRKLILIQTYEDINKTGSNIFRKGLEQLMKDAREGKFKTVFIKDWSRLSRNIIDQETIVKELSSIGIEVISCDGVTDKKIRQVTGLTNEWFIDECRKKQQQVHKLKLEAKIPCNRPPFGYTFSKKMKKFVINPEESEDVKRIFELRSEGKSINEISKQFSMSSSKVFGILKNKTYLGFIKYKSELIQAHEPIISEKLFNKVNNNSVE